MIRWFKNFSNPTGIVRRILGFHPSTPKPQFLFTVIVCGLSTIVGMNTTNMASIIQSLLISFLSLSVLNRLGLDVITNHLSLFISPVRGFNLIPEVTRNQIFCPCPIDLVNEVARILPQRNINEADREGNSPLMTEVERVNVTRIKKMIKLGANPNYINPHTNITIFTTALNSITTSIVQQNKADFKLKLKIIKQLIKAGTNLNVSFDEVVICAAISEPKNKLALKLVNILLKNGAKIENAMSTVDAAAPYILQISLTSPQKTFQCIKILRFLLTQGADLSQLGSLIDTNPIVANELKKPEWQALFKEHYEELLSLTQPRTLKDIVLKALHHQLEGDLEYDQKPLSEQIPDLVEAYRLTPKRERQRERLHSVASNTIEFCRQRLFVD